MNRWKLQWKTLQCFTTSGKQAKPLKKKQKKLTRQRFSKLKKLNSKARSTNRRMSCLPYCKSIAELAEQKARTGQRCSRACTECTANGRAGKLPSSTGYGATVPE